MNKRISINEECRLWSASLNMSSVRPLFLFVSFTSSSYVCTFNKSVSHDIQLSGWNSYALMVHKFMSINDSQVQNHRKKNEEKATKSTTAEKKQRQPNRHVLAIVSIISHLALQIFALCRANLDGYSNW